MRHQKAGFRHPVLCHAGLLEVEARCPVLSYPQPKVKALGRWMERLEELVCPVQPHHGSCLGHGSKEALWISLNGERELKCPVPTQAWNHCLCCLIQIANACENPAEKMWKQGMAGVPCPPYAHPSCSWERHSYLPPLPAAHGYACCSLWGINWSL